MAAHQAPPSLGFSRQEHGVGCRFLLQCIKVKVKSLSCVWLFVTLWTEARQASLSINSRSLLKFMSIKSVMPSHHLIVCYLLLLLPSIFPSIWVFTNKSVLHARWPKYWSFSFNISPSNEYLGLISFRIGWLDLLAVQGTLKSLLQHHSFSLVLGFPYSPTLTSIHDYWKNSSTTWTFVGKVMSLLNITYYSKFLLTILIS